MKRTSSRPCTWPDAELVRAARAGDVTSMGLLLHRHRPALYATALAILGHGQRAQDAVQDASLIALRRVHDLQEPAVFGGWLCAIGRNISLMELRRSRRELLVAELPVGTERDALFAYEEEVERHALRDWLWNALDDLPEAQQLVVMLRHFGRERCYEEIAEICAVPVETVRSRLNAARRALAERLLEAATSSDMIDGREERWRSRLAEVLDGVNRGDRSPADMLFASDAVIMAGGRVSARDEVLPALLRDSDDGVRVRVGCVVAGAGVVVLDGDIENPPEDPFHCPPAFTWVGLHDESTISSLRFHHPRTRSAAAREEQMADDVAALCHRLGIEHPIVFGHSAGGFVALHLALRHVELPCGLILCDSAPTLAPLADDDPPAGLAERAGGDAVAVAQRLFAGDFSPATQEAFGRLVVPYYAAPSHIDVPGRLMALSSMNPDVATHFFSQLAPRYDLRARLGEIAVPTLVVVGRHDWVCPPAASRVIADAIPRARLVELSDAGHFGFSETPEPFLRAVRAHIARTTTLVDSATP